MSDNVLRSSEAAPADSEAAGDVAVRVRGLTKRYGDLEAVTDVSFDIREGEFFTILGPSGSGKSTLLRTLAGLEDPTEGTITINGRDMGNVPPERRPTNMIFQHLALFPHKNVYQNLEFGLKMQGLSAGERREQADEMLSMLGLTGYGDNDIRELSGGEQQRVALGRSLLTNPDILLLDEPLSSLDRKLRDEMQLELRRIHDELQSTFLYVTHDQDVALTAADRVAVINEGRVVQVGTPRELYEAPANRFVAEFIGDTNILTGRVIAVDGDRLTVETDDGLRLTVATDADRPEGSRVQLSVRPEELLIGAAAADRATVFEATVSERIYRGDRTRYVVSIDGTDLLLQRSRRSGDREFEAGDTATVGLPATAGYVLEDGED